MSDVKDINPSNEGADAASVELFDFYVAQLEAYLDGELDTDEATEVRKRLMQEEAYAAALGRLHSQRIQRIEAYRRIEREETDLEAASRIAASARRLAVQDRAYAAGSWPTWTKLVFGMAACLLVGFAAGMIGVYDFGDEPIQGEARPLDPADSSATGEGARWVYIDENNQQQAVIPAEPKAMPRTLDHQPDPTLGRPPQ